MDMDELMDFLLKDESLHSIVMLLKSVLLRTPKNSEVLVLEQMANLFLHDSKVS